MTCAALACASAAAANDVTLWACHGPGGEPLDGSVFGEGAWYGVAGDLDAGGCETPAGGLTAHLTSASGGGYASLSVGTPQLPLNVALESVRLTRTTTGFSDQPPEPAQGTQHYAVKADSTVLESADQGAAATRDGDVTLALPTPAPVNRVTVGVSCDAPINASCAGTPVGVDVKRLGLTVSDDVKPHAVGGIGAVAGAPSGGALYGALEVIGLPPDAATRAGVVRSRARGQGPDRQAQVQRPMTASRPIRRVVD